jgi:hypothetical protein
MGHVPNSMWCFDVHAHVHQCMMHCLPSGSLICQRDPLAAVAESAWHADTLYAAMCLHVLQCCLLAEPFGQYY